MSPSKMMSQTGRVLSTHTVPCVTVPVRDLATGLTNYAKTLTLQTLNPNIIKLQYAVRGPLVLRALEIKKELAKGTKKPFKQIINANIGDGQAMGQKPITYFRQVVSGVLNPALLKSDTLPSDVKARAKAFLDVLSGHSAGAYTMSNGVEMVRRHVAEYIEARDGHKANWENIVITQGASPGIKNCLALLVNKVDSKNTGVMVPIPQYPLYSATLAEYGMGQVGYYLDENNNWGLDMQELERAYQEGSKKYAVRGIVVINPGNPTGQVLTEENQKDLLKFAHKNSLFVMADEVYQNNVYAPCSKFTSFKKVMTEMGAPHNEIELASFMSISKCYMSECGLRGGWMELVNLDPAVVANLYKAISATLCPNTVGQCVVDMVAKPPLPEDPSYKQWLEERTAVLSSLKLRAKMCVETFNKMKGFKCNVVQGAMYAFPRIELPPKAVEAAKAAKKPPDTFYAFALLEETGICIVPGSGFGQCPGTYHFRTTILPQPQLLQEMLDTFKVFHEKFTKKYS